MENENQIVFSLIIDGKAKAIVLETVIVHLLNYVRRTRHQMFVDGLQRHARFVLLELVLSVTGARDVQAVLSVPHKMTQTQNQELIR